MSSFKMVALAAVLFGSTASAAPRLSDDTSALARIDRAHAEGRIDDATHALLGMRLARAPRTLPAEFRPAADEPRIRCGTLLARRAFLMAKNGTFNAAQSAEFAVLGSRPNYPNTIQVLDGNATPVAKVHYPATVSGTLAQNIADYLSESWNTEFATFGWRVPPPDVGGTAADPDVQYDFYLDPNEFGGVTIPIQEVTCTGTCTASFIILEPGVPNVETYVAHELNHGSQFAYDYSDGDFVYEATATWMEDKVYDPVNDYEFFIADFQHAPSTTLSLATYDNTYMYGGAVFFHWMSDVYGGGGATLVRDVWDNLEGQSPDWYDGVETVLASDGFADISEIYREFAGARALTGARDDGTIEEGENMTSLSFMELYDFGSLDGGSTSDPPMGMGANYLLVNPSSAGVGDEITLHVSSREPGPWGITTIAMPSAGTATIAVFLDEDGDGKVEATVTDVASFNEIAFAITNTANAAEGTDSQFDTIDESTHDFSWNFGGGGGGDPTGCGCTIPAGRRSPNTASVLAAFFVAAFTIVMRRK